MVMTVTVTSYLDLNSSSSLPVLAALLVIVLVGKEYSRRRRRKRAGLAHVGGGADNQTFWRIAASNAEITQNNNKEDVDRSVSVLSMSSLSPASSSPTSSSSPRARAEPTGLSRRQKKNRRNNGAEINKKPDDPEVSKAQKKKGQPILEMFQRMDMTEEEIYEALVPYIHRKEVLRAHGYPIISELESGKAFIYVSSLKPDSSSSLPSGLAPSASSPTLSDLGKAEDGNKSCLNPNAREFTPRSSVISKETSPTSAATLRPTAEEFVPKSNSSLALNEQVEKEINESNDSADGSSWDEDVKECLRCYTIFYISNEGVYLNPEKCYYHWGKIKGNQYRCCFKSKNSKGCHEGNLHVWKGLPYRSKSPIIYLTDYVVTKPKKSSSSQGKLTGVYAMDAEMAFTAFGLELIRLTVVGVDGRLVYEAYVNPTNEIIDYNTRFSGITKHILERRANKTLKEVQNDLQGFIFAHTILIGHGLENDLRVLKLVHENVIDTAIVFLEGQYRYSLKALARGMLNRDIQTNSHDSLEDAAASMELMLWKVWNDKQQSQQDPLSQPAFAGSQQVWRRRKRSGRQQQQNK